MKLRYCDCGKPIPQTSRNGNRLAPSRYIRRTTCGSGVCVKAKCGTEPDEYPDRFCKTCGTVISKYSRGGLLLRYSKYIARKTCDKAECRSAALNGHRTEQTITIVLSPMDLFLGVKL